MVDVAAKPLKGPPRVTDALWLLRHEALVERLEALTKDTPSWYASTSARVEARAALEQAEELRRVLEELGERLR